MQRKKIMIGMGIVIGAILFVSVGLVSLFIYALDWEGSEHDLRVYLLPAYIQHVPRIGAIADSVRYRSKFQDGTAPGFDCIRYSSTATQPEILDSMASYLLSQGFQKKGAPAYFAETNHVDFYSDGKTDVDVTLSSGDGNMSVDVCNSWY
jgi:hypothetical protein